MPIDEARLKLAAWLSPGYPISAYAYSHGLEAAIADGRIGDAASAQDWVEDCLTHGAGRNDAILLARAWRSDDAEELAELAAALAPARERLTETTAMGAAFAETTAAAWGPKAAPRPYPIAVGLAARAHGIALDETLALFVQAYVGALVSAAVRLTPLGQTDGQKIIAALTPACLRVAREAAAAEIAEIGGCALLSDIAAMRHETLETRIFRT